MDAHEQARIRELCGEIADIEALSRDMLEFLPRIRDPFARRLWQFRAEQVLDAAAERAALLRGLEAGEREAFALPPAGEPVADLGAQLRFCDSVGEIAEVEELTREALELVPRIRDPHARRLWKAHAGRVLQQATEKRAQLAASPTAAPPAAVPPIFSLLRWLTPLGGLLLCAALAVAASQVGRGWGRAPLLPLVFLGVVLTVTRYFGTLVGVLGCLLSAGIFALYLFPPFGSFVVEDSAALTSLGAMISGGTSLSCYLGAKLAASKRPFAPSSLS